MTAMRCEDPVFVLAPPRSFTSLVCGMLGQHPELVGLPELNLFQFETMNEFWTGRSEDNPNKSATWNVMRHGLLRVIAQLYFGEQTVASIGAARRWIIARSALSTTQVYRMICEKMGTLRIIEKSPAYIRKRKFLDRLNEAFPRARFIHLLRHPRTQCESALKVKGGPMTLFLVNSIDRRQRLPVLDPQVLWHDSQIQITGFLSQIEPERQIRIRGESILTDTDHTLGRICDWLGIASGKEALQAMRHPEDSPFACVGPANARLGNDINFLRNPRFREARNGAAPKLDGELPWRKDGQFFHPKVISLAREFGYE